MKKTIIILFLFIFLFSLTACSGGKQVIISNEPSISYKEKYSYDMPVNDYQTNSYENDDAVENNGYISVERKLITTVDMTAETKEFDFFIQNLNQLIAENGAYSEKFNLTKSDYKSYRYASYVIRIPTENLSSFLDTTKQLVNVLRYSEKTDDVSLQYADIEGQLSSLKAEQIALNKMLENAVNVSESIEIQKRLSVVRGEIESFESQLRVLSSKISYSTLNLNVNEVIELTDTPQEISVWEELTQKFKASFDDTVSYLRDMFIEIIGGIPYILAVLVTLIVILFIPFIIVLIIVLCVKKNKKKKINKQNQINTLNNFTSNSK